jgi:hypothetical protein
VSFDFCIDDHGSLVIFRSVSVRPIHLDHDYFAAWLRPLYRQDWIVYLKRPFGGPEYVLQYLGRYTHRVAISNHRLVSFADGQVTYRWRDSADHNKQKLLPLPVDEFLTRFLLHLLALSCAGRVHASQFFKA